MDKIEIMDEIESMLVEFDEYGFEPTITLPFDGREFAKAWKSRILDCIHRLQSESQKQYEDYCLLEAENSVLRQENENLRIDNEDLREKNENLYELGLNENTERFEDMKKIERLEDEVQRLAIVEMDLIGKIADKSAEIERLTEEHERIAWSKHEYLDWVHGFLSTHTDMKDRGEDYKMFDRDWMCGVFWAKIEGSIEYIIDLENQRNELQKQVDELTAFKNEAISLSLYGKGREDGKAETVRKTIDDMGKEIYKRVTDNLKMWLRERYDVEVE